MLLTSAHVEHLMCRGDLSLPGDEPQLTTRFSSTVLSDFPPTLTPYKFLELQGGLFINTLALLTPGWSERDRESLRGAPWNCPEPRALMEGDIMDKLEDMASVYEFDPLTDNIPATKVEITVSCRQDKKPASCVTAGGKNARAFTPLPE